MSIYSDPKREHDSFYKNEDHFSHPKEYFKKAGSILTKEMSSRDINHKLDFLDIGCAAGDFLRYIDSITNKKHSINFFGSDVMHQLIEESKKRFPKGRFEYSDLSKKKVNLENIFNTQFDFISMLSVHMIFDELFWIKNIVKSLKGGGLAIIWGLFNPYPYDLIMRVKKSGEDHYEPGWNVHSKKSILQSCKSLNVDCKFIDFQPDIDLNRDPEDGLRSWSLKVDSVNKANSIENNIPIFESEKERIFTSATRIIHDFSFCLIKKI